MVRSIFAALIALMLAAPTAVAEEAVPVRPTNIRASVEKIRFDAPSLARSSSPQIRFQQQKPTSLPTKITAGFVGAFLGFCAGGYIGAKLEPSCACDDPGLQGFVIGAPIGAIAGAIGAVKLVSR